MKLLFNLFVSLIDFFYKKKIIYFFKNNLSNELHTIIDVGAHKGETISDFLYNFKIKNIYSFEASSKTFNNLKIRLKKIKKIFFLTNIEIFNIGVGNTNKKGIFYELPDSNSSTFNIIDQNSSYFKRKNKILSFFFLDNKKIINKTDVSQIKLCEFIKDKKIQNIDILKIDTEGYEFEVIKGLEQEIKKINFIYFEHHYDNMIKKNYKYSDIHDYLRINGFHKVYKIKMPLRKSFDYIYKKTI
jgi:FkbM family methyltransferase